jgi:hypothetical protein
MKRVVAIVTAWVLLGVGCAGSAEPAAESRYPEKRRPPPLRSASDGEILGADGVPPEDRREVSPTNTHPAKGWVIENGALVPEKEARHRAEAHERAGHAQEGKPGASEPDCDPTLTSAAGATAASAPGSDGRKRKPCPPSAPSPAPSPAPAKP